VKSLRRILSIVIVIIIFYFLISNLILNWQRIPFAELRFDIGSLFLSYLCLFVYFLIFVAGWKHLIKGLGDSISYGKAFWIISTSQIAKYVPGGIWYTLGRVYLCTTEGMKGQIVFLSVILETCFLMLTNMVLFLVSVAFLPGTPVLSPFISVAIIIVLLIFIYPPILNWFVNIVLKVIKRPLIVLNVSYPSMVLFSLYFVGVWIAQIVGFYFLVNAIYPLGISHIFSLSAAYTLAWITGFIVLFAPAGLGVREGMMTLMLSTIIATPLAIVMSFVQRVWISVFEIVVFLVGLVVKTTASKTHHRPLSDRS
jgi:uncharacterized membrane protein YbhN (UPF0104 family)